MTLCNVKTRPTGAYPPLLGGCAVQVLFALADGLLETAFDGRTQCAEGRASKQSKACLCILVEIHNCAIERRACGGHESTSRTGPLTLVSVDADVTAIIGDKVKRTCRRRSHTHGHGHIQATVIRKNTHDAGGAKQRVGGLMTERTDTACRILFASPRAKAFVFHLWVLHLGRQLAHFSVCNRHHPRIAVARP